MHCPVTDTQKTGREIILENLEKEVKIAFTGDLHRAVDFLRGAREIRQGCKQKRRQSRINQKNAWKKRVDDSIVW